MSPNELVISMGQCTVPVDAKGWPIGQRCVFELWMVLVQNADSFPLSRGEKVQWVEEWLEGDA